MQINNTLAIILLNQTHPVWFPESKNIQPDGSLRENMKNITLEELLEAGCHFGHQVTRQNPKAKDYIFEARDNIHIIDLEKTKECLEEAGEFVKNLAKRGGTMLVLGTKRQAHEVIDEEVKNITDQKAEGIYWVTRRWVGGTFTNFGEVSKNFRKLREIEDNLRDEETRSQFTKREIGEWEKERQKLLAFYAGIASMNRTPDAIFILDTHMENLAVREAKAMNIKTVGITDTNSDPTVINYPIPANDDAAGSIKLIVGYILEAWREGKKQAKDLAAKIEKEEEAKAAKEKAKAEKDELKAKKKEEDKKAEKDTKAEKPKKESKAKSSK